MFPALGLSSLADCLGSYTGCVEAGEAGGVHHFISGTTLYKSGEHWQGIFSGLKQLCPHEEGIIHHINPNNYIMKIFSHIAFAI